MTNKRINARSEAARGWNAHRQPVPGSNLETASLDARDAALELDRGALRREATPVRRSFIRGLREPIISSPMLKLYRGGRNGGVAIRLYLAILWKCSSPPFSTQVPARAWATLLDLPDPEHAGARRVRSALDKLEEHRLIDTHSVAGQVTIVTLLREDGTGSKYLPPSGAYMRAAANKRGKQILQQHEYLRINNDLWTSGLMQSLSGPALAMLLVLLAEGGDRGDPVWMSTKLFQERYGLSPTTRAKGIHELVSRRLVAVNRSAVPDVPGGSVFQRQRFRDIYSLCGAALAPLDTYPS